MEATQHDANHSISDADLHDALINERADIEEAKTVLDGCCTLCKTVNWIFLCHTVLVQVIIVLLLHQIVMQWLRLVFAMRVSLFLLMKHKIHRGWNVHQLDIKTTFLNSDLHEEVYVS